MPLAAAVAETSAVGGRYRLPAPLSLYVAGIGIAVVVAYAILAALGRWQARSREGAPAQPVPARLARVFGAPRLTVTLRVMSAALFALVVAAGFLGEQNPYRNPASIFVWNLWWTAMVLASAVLGEVWSLINPWKIVFAGAAATYRRARPRRRGLGLRYPESLAAWPAVALFVILAWMALVWQATATPAGLAAAIVLYSLITWSGMATFGAKTWLQNGEAFTVAFALLARFAPVGARAGGRPRWEFRLPGAGLVGGPVLHPSQAALIVAMLAAALADAAADTPLWSGIMDRVIADPALWPLVSALGRVGLDVFAAVKTVAWALFVPLCAAVYLAVAALAARAGGERRTTGEVACGLVVALVPVIVAYHLAHDALDVLSAVRSLAVLAAEPLWGGALGADAARAATAGAAPARLWYATIAALAAGHLVAVAVAPAAASRLFRDGRAARRGASPIALLVAGHAALSLWVLSFTVVADTAGGP